MSRASQIALTALAPILGVQDAPTPSARIEPVRKSRRRRHHRRNKSSKGRWVAKELGMQSVPADECVDDDAWSDDGLDLSDGKAAGEVAEEAEEDDEIDNLPIASTLTCNLTGAPLQEPITTPSGQHYNKSALEEWMLSAGPVDPTTGAPLDLNACRLDPELQEAAFSAQLGALCIEAKDHLQSRQACLVPKEDEQVTKHLADLPPLKQPCDYDSRSKATLGKAGIYRRRATISEVPQKLRCAIDGKFMSQPIRSPHGHVFERKTLERWVSCCGSVCPITSKPLRLQDCWIDAQLHEDMKHFRKDRRGTPNS
jgi:hypothetical protein